MLINFLVRRYNVQNFKFLICFVHENTKKKKKSYFAEIFINFIAVQTIWHLESRIMSHQILLMQDWVFRLEGRANVRQTAKLLFLKTCCEETKFLKAEIPPQSSSDNWDFYSHYMAQRCILTFTCSAFLWKCC